MSLRMRLIMGIGIPVVLLVIIGVIAITNIKSIVATNDQVGHTYVVLGKADGIIGSAVDMETGMRGYLLAGEEEFLAPYKGGEKATYEGIKSLQKTVNDNPKQVARLGEVEAVLKEWQEKVTEPMIALRREIGDAQTMNDIADLVAEARGKQYFDKFRGLIGDFIGMEEKLLNERKQSGGTQNFSAGGTDWTTHTYEVIIKANTILEMAINTETGMRGYLLAGQEGFLAPYTEGSKRFFELVGEMKQTVNDNPVQVKRMQDIETTIKEWLTAVVEPTIELRRAIGDAKNMDDMADLVGEAHGKQYFDKFRSLMADFKAEEENLMAIRQESNRSTVSSTMTIVIACVVVAVIIGLILIFWITAAVLKQVGGEPSVIAGKAKQIAEGNLNVTFDEQSGIAFALGQMVENLKLKIEEANKAMEDAAQEAERAKVAMGEADEAKKQAERAKSEGMNAAAEQISGILERVTSASEELSAQVEQASRGSEVQRERAGETATAMEEMNATVLEVAKNASSAAENASTAKDKSEEGTEVVKQVVEAINKVQTQATVLKDNMTELGTQADGIGQIMNVISDIADQTNLLALNAAIEAARAGDAGRGFAVVADEVRKLAEKTMAATKEVGSSINAIQDGTRKNITETDKAVEVVGESTGLAGKAGDMLREILTLSETNADQVRNIATGAEQQSAASEEINRGTEEINRISSETSEAMTQSAKAVSELAELAQEMQRLVEEMRQA